MFRTHYFNSTKEAYDNTQTGYIRFIGPLHAWTETTDFVEIEVEDGDLLVIPNEGVYGFLYEAWPLAYVPSDTDVASSGELHTIIDEDAFFADHPHYKEVWQVAKELYELHYGPDVK